MSMPSSLSDAVDVDAVREDVALRIHCSSSAIMRASREMSRTCDEQHCMRALAWRCIRRRVADARERIGGEWTMSASLGGVDGLDGSMRKLCRLSFEARSPIVHGGVYDRLV